jgi:2,4-dienoyl-CoA reductase-like NADH-dependent reductase (Old Yellow Enzyme family)
MSVRLADPVRIGRLELRNRLYRAPVLEGAARSASPAATYVKHFSRNARAGVGLIVQGHTTVTVEGATSPGMSHVDGRDDLLALRAVPDAVHAHGARIVVQLGHGGLFALEGWHRDYMARRRSRPLAPSQVPWWLRAAHGGAHVLTTDEVRALGRRFATVAAWARDAGYDGVQIAACNAKLGHQFLSRTYNRRTDAYGGSLENRVRWFAEVREAIAEEAGPDFPVLLKYTAVETGTPGGGVHLDDGIAIGIMAEKAGYDALTPAAVSAFPDTGLCRGAFPAASWSNARLRRGVAAAAGETGRLGMQASMRLSAWRSPFEPVWNRAVFTAVKREVRIPVLAVGGIRTGEEAAEILSSGAADLVGLGRPFYAEPELPAEILAAGSRWASRCGSCNRCLVPQMLGMPGVCYNPAVVGRS